MLEMDNCFQYEDAGTIIVRSGRNHYEMEGDDKI